MLYDFFKSQYSLCPYSYRLTVLRTLPHLQKLDNVPVEGEEVQQAMVSGLLLPIGQDRLVSSMPTS